MAEVEARSFDAPDGSQTDIGPGEVVAIPPGHDAEVLGDEACEMVDFGEFGNYAKRT